MLKLHTSIVMDRSTKQKEGTATDIPVSAVIVHLHTNMFEEQAIKIVQARDLGALRIGDMLLLKKAVLSTFCLDSQKTSNRFTMETKTVRLPYYTRRFREYQKAASPPVSTENRHTLINT